jgi:hypothetical protein
MPKDKPLLLTMLFCLLPTVALADNLYIKPGLWESTVVVETKGAPPMSAEKKAEMEKGMAKMSPEMRAKMEAAINSATANMGKPHTTKSCITKEDLSKPMDLASGKDDRSCTQTIVKATSTVQEVRVSCVKGTQKSSNTLRIVASNPETWSGTMEGSMGDTGGAMQMKSKMSGKWLGSDCGDVKPRTHK